MGSLWPRRDSKAGLGKSKLHLLSAVPVPSFHRHLSILVTFWISATQSNIFQNLVEEDNHCCYNKNKNTFGKQSAKQNERSFYALGLLRAFNRQSAVQGSRRNREYLGFSNPI